MVAKVLFGCLFFLAASAQADMYQRCKVSGQSDGSVFSVPATIRLEEAGRWYFSADKKAVKDAEVRPGKRVVYVSYDELNNGSVFQYRYTFDISQCDSEQVGSATLVKKLTGAQDGRGTDPIKSSTAIYKCDCAVD